MGGLVLVVGQDPDECVCGGTMHVRGGPPHALHRSGSFSKGNVSIVGARNEHPAEAGLSCEQACLRNAHAFGSSQELITLELAPATLRGRMLVT